MTIDQVVQIALFVGLIVVGIDHWRRGQRGWRLAALVFVSFYGVGLVVTMSAHCADIIHNLALRNRSMDGSPFAYNWRTYSLLLFGVLLIDRGIRVLRAARRFAAGDPAARSDILQERRAGPRHHAAADSRPRGLRCADVRVEFAHADRCGGEFAGWPGSADSLRGRRRRRLIR